MHIYKNNFIFQCHHQPVCSNSSLITDANGRDIVFLLDGSDDSQQKFPDIIDFVKRITKHLNVDINKDRMAVVQYSDTAEINFNLSRYSTKNDILKAVNGLRHKGGYPHNIGAALQYLKEHVYTPMSGSRRQEGIPQILILLIGGRSADDIRTPARMMKQIGAISVVIGTSDADTLELQTIAHEPKYALPVAEYGQLPSVQEDVLALIREALHHVEQIAPTAGLGKNQCFPYLVKRRDWRIFRNRHCHILFTFFFFCRF